MDLSRTALVREVQAALTARTRARLTDAQHAARGAPLRDFLRACWPIIEPSTPLVWNWHLDAICDHVQALLEGRLGKQNLIVLVPPGCLKSSIVSVAAPSWWWITHPSWR